MLSEKAYMKQVMLYLKNKDYASAVKIAEQMHANYPNSYASSFALAKAYFWSNHFDDAERLCREAIGRAKTSEQKYSSYFLIASVYIALSNPEAAYKSLKKIPRSTMSEQYWELMVLLDSILGKDSSKDFARLHAINREAAGKLLLDIMLKYKL